MRKRKPSPLVIRASNPPGGRRVQTRPPPSPSAPPPCAARSRGLGPTPRGSRIRPCTAHARSPRPGRAQCWAGFPARSNPRGSDPEASRRAIEPLPPAPGPDRAPRNTSPQPGPRLAECHGPEMRKPIPAHSPCRTGDRRKTPSPRAPGLQTSRSQRGLRHAHPLRIQSSAEQWNAGKCLTGNPGRGT